VLSVSFIILRHNKRSRVDRQRDRSLCLRDNILPHLKGLLVICHLLDDVKQLTHVGNASLYLLKVVGHLGKVGLRNIFLFDFAFFLSQFNMLVATVRTSRAEPIGEILTVT